MLTLLSQVTDVKEEAKRRIVWQSIMQPLCYKIYVYVGMSYIKAGVIYIKMAS